MLKDKKIKIQQCIIEDLKAENKKLTEELELLKADLEFEKNFKNKEYDTAKDLIVELNKEKAIYEDLIQKANLARDKYKEKEKEINELKVKYSKEMKNLLKDIKRNI